MIRTPAGRANRSAFTLIELLIVLLIIIALASLLVAAVSKVMVKIPEVQTRTEIGEMETALAAFMADYNLQDPPPSNLFLCENGHNYYGANGQIQPQYQTTVAFLSKWFGRSFNIQGTYDWNGDGNTAQSYVLTGQQCLVFYLGGIPIWSGIGVVHGTSGFSTNIANPALPASAAPRRKGPYFNFVPSRLALAGHFPVYYDPWQVKGRPQAYAFFSTQGTVNGYSAADCGGSATSPLPYYEATVGGGVNYAYNNRFQIISAGKDGYFGGNNGTGGTSYGNPWSSSSGAAGYGADDQANFSSTLLGIGQH